MWAKDGCPDRTFAYTGVGMFTSSSHLRAADLAPASPARSGGCFALPLASLRTNPWPIAMNHTRDNGHLNIELDRDLNLFTARYIERLAESATSVTVNLRAARLVDTEGIISLDRMQRAGKEVTVRNPPDIFFDVLRALDLTGLFTIDADAT